MFQKKICLPSEGSTVVVVARYGCTYCRQKYIFTEAKTFVKTNMSKSCQRNIDN